MSIDRAAIAGWIPGYSYAADDITIDRTAGLDDKGLSGADAHATTGDVAEVLRAILESAYQHFISVPVAERPVNFRITKSSSIDAQTGVVSKAYTVRHECASEGFNTIPEPVE